MKLLVLEFYNSFKSLDQPHSGKKNSKDKQGLEAMIPIKDHHRKPTTLVKIVLGCGETIMFSSHASHNPSPIPLLSGFAV